MYDGTISTTFGISNGVKQIGVLSPFLFGIYIHEFLNALTKSLYACHIGNIFVGVFAHPDDIVLLSPTRRGLQQMLEVADNFSKAYDIKFKETKSELLIYSNNSLKDIYKHKYYMVMLLSEPRNVQSMSDTWLVLVRCRQPLRPVLVILTVG